MCDSEEKKIAFHKLNLGEWTTHFAFHFHFQWAFHWSTHSLLLINWSMLMRLLVRTDQKIFSFNSSLFMLSLMPKSAAEDSRLSISNSSSKWTTNWAKAKIILHVYLSFYLLYYIFSVSVNSVFWVGSNFTEVWAIYSIDIWYHCCCCGLEMWIFKYKINVNFKWRKKF